MSNRSKNVKNWERDEARIKKLMKMDQMTSKMLQKMRQNVKLSRFGTRNEPKLGTNEKRLNKTLHYT